MDTTQTYIRQCDCPEIQGECKLKKKDKYRNIRESSCVDGIVIVLGNFFCYQYEEGRSADNWFDNDAIWLPRQDQLQEMVNHYCNNLYIYRPYGLLKNLMDWCELDRGYAYGQFDSLEQLWLAFVMHKLHRLTWDEKGGWV